jgi:hypothetical protein
MAAKRVSKAGCEWQVSRPAETFSAQREAEKAARRQLARSSGGAWSAPLSTLGGRQPLDPVHVPLARDAFQLVDSVLCQP